MGRAVGFWFWTIRKKLGSHHSTLITSEKLNILKNQELRSGTEVMPQGKLLYPKLERLTSKHKE